MIAGTHCCPPLTAAASAYELQVPASSGYDFFVELRDGTWILSGAPPAGPQVQLSPELLVKAERAAKFFQEFPDDDPGNDPDYGLL